MESIQGRCTFEPIGREDILGAVETLQDDRPEESRRGHGIHLPALGDGEDYLSWAVAELRASWGSPAEQKSQHTTAAVVHARRAISRLVDQYVCRDAFDLCRQPPRNSWDKSSTLVRRGVIDELTQKVLARAIDVRNSAEHAYVCPDEVTAEDVVELMRRTSDSLLAKSIPNCGPCLFGSFFYSWTMAPAGDSVRFHGWSKAPGVMLARFAPQPWLGIVLPTAKDHALIRRLPLSEVPWEMLADVLNLIERKYGTTNGGSSVQFWQMMAEVAGFSE